jgi:signal peptidase I
LATRTSIPCTSAAFAELSADILRAGKALRFRATGASMQPLLRDGDVLLVRPLDPRAVRVGDVVLCSSEPGRIVVHRVLRRQAGPEGYRFTVQGDQVARPDGVIPEAQVYGRVATIERSGAYIDVSRPLMRMLGGYAVLRSRWNIGRGRRLRLAGRLVKRLPVLSRYLV